MPVTVVVGAQWGDEGKAKVIDLLAKEHHLVVRYQGGHNAGHTIVVDGERYALQLVPSGVLYDHVTPVIANGVVVDPITLLDEIDRLTSRGVDCSRLKLSSQAHLIMPWHFAYDRISETRRGDDKIGTTLKGIGPAYADKARRVGFRAGDLLDRARFREQVGVMASLESEEITHLGGEPLDVAAIVDRYAGELADRVAPFVTNTVALLHDALARGEHLLLEGAQATFLDLDHGTYPVRHVVEPDGWWGVHGNRARPTRPRAHRRASRRRTRPGSAPARSRRSSPTSSATAWSTSATSSAR